MPVAIAKDLETTILAAFQEARERRHEYVTLEHLLYAMSQERNGIRMLLAVGADPKALYATLTKFLTEGIESLPDEGDKRREPEQTMAFRRVMARAAAHVQSSGRQ